MYPALGLAAMEQSPIPTVLTDDQAHIVDVNDAYLQMSRRGREELIGMSSIELIHAEDLPGCALAVHRAASEGVPVRNRRRHLRPDGTSIEVDALLSFITFEGRRLLLVQLVGTGAEAEVDSHDEALLRLNNEQFGDITSAHNADGLVEFATINFETPFGLPLGWFRGRLLTDSERDPINADGEPIKPGDDPVVQCLATGESLTTTLGLTNVDGDRLWFSVRVVPDPPGRYAARVTLRDVSDLIASQQRAAYLAEIMERELTHRVDHDSLTGLKARHVVTATLESRQEAGLSTSVVFVDLDRFKDINDTVGHVIGDEVLMAVGESLQTLGRNALVISRTGGDEFLAVFDDPDDAELFVSSVEARSLTAPPLPAVTASVGVSHSTDFPNARDLVAHADAAMYNAKKRDRQHRYVGSATR